MISFWTTFFICFLKMVFAQNQQVFSGTLQLYNWADPSQKIIAGNNTYTTTFNNPFTTVPTLALISTQGFSFEYHNYLAFNMSQISWNQSTIYYYLSTNQNQFWFAQISYFIYNDVYNQFRNINLSSYYIGPIDNDIQTGSGSRYMTKNISYSPNASYNTNETFTSNNLQIWSIIQGFQVTASSKLYINVHTSFDFVHSSIIMNISVNYDTELTALSVKSIAYSTIFSSITSRVSYITHGTTLMNEGLVQDMGISDYNASFIYSFIGLSGLYTDLSSFSLGTVLFNLSSSIYQYESNSIKYLKFGMTQNDSISTSSSPKINFFYLIIYKPLQSLTSNAGSSSSSSMIYGIIGAVIGIVALLGGSILFYKFYLKKRLIRKKFQLKPLQNIRFQI